MSSIINPLWPITLSRLYLSWQVETYATDELIFHGGMRVSFAMQLMGAAARIEKEIPSINWPFLLLHGDDDKLCDIRGSKMMYENAPCSDKKIKVRMGCFREVLWKFIGKVFRLIFFSETAW